MQNCYSQKKVSRDVVDEQNERLTSKHINTLKFLQDTVAENKELKLKVEKLEEQCSQCAELHDLTLNGQTHIKDIQEQHLQHVDNINQQLTDKHKAEVMKKVEEKVEAEKQWFLEKEKLLAEIEQLKKENALLHKQLADAVSRAELIKVLEQQVAELQRELDQAREDRNKLDQTGRNQFGELQRLEYVEELNKNLKDEVAEANQKVTELQFKVKRLEKEAKEYGLPEQEEIMKVLKEKLSKMHKEKLALEGNIQERGKGIDDLKSENDKLRRALNDSERMRGEGRIQIENLMHEVANLRRQLLGDKDRQTFRDFVQLKRDMAEVRDENEQLKIQLMFSSKKTSKHSLPRLKPEGATVNNRPSSAGARGDWRRKSDSAQQPQLQLKY